MSNEERSAWIKWEFRLAGAALAIGVIATLAGADARCLGISLGIIILGEIMRDQVIISRSQLRRDEERRRKSLGPHYDGDLYRK